MVSMLLPRRVKRLGHVVLVWAMGAIFAVMPAISVTMATPAGAFSRVFVHIHALDDHDQDDGASRMHEVAHDHGTTHDHWGQHDHDAGHHQPNQDGTGGYGSPHVHYEIASPSGLVPGEAAPVILNRLSSRLRVPAASEPPDAGTHGLLRPPI